MTRRKPKLRLGWRANRKSRKQRRKPLSETKEQQAWRERQQETRDEKMTRLREEQLLLHRGEAIERPRVVGKPHKTKYQRAKGRDAFYGSCQGGAPG